ncbi:MAG TPA: hypothetical protein VEV17_00540 [Bryobacteraceae bacterium]|nr:hypothetical protein [Bryobacteraceae bacterium]
MDTARTRITTLFLTVLSLGFAPSMAAQNFDTSGNATLQGPYFVRQVLLANLDPNTSAIGRAISLTGIMTFDGNGNFSFSGQVMDTKSPGGPQAYAISGQYAVQSNGLLQIQNPIDGIDGQTSVCRPTQPAGADIDYGAAGAIGPSAIVASATEGLCDDVLVAIPITGPGASNASVQGSFRTGFIDFLLGNASLVRDGFFTLNSDGNGNFGNVTVTGAMANQGSAPVSQNLSNVTYFINSADGSGAISFPATPNALFSLITGQKTFFVSADGNILLGGSPGGFDLMVGISAASGVSNATYQGTYFTAALENDASDLANGNNNVDSFYGSTLAAGQGADIAHLRLAFFNVNAYDFTTDGGYNFTPDGFSQTSFFEDLLGANGQAILEVGTSSLYSLTVGLRAPQYPATNVFLDPVRIWNGASFAPITNSVAPGEYLSLFGSGLSPTALQAAGYPLLNNLGGVQVTVNGLFAPLTAVSPTEIDLIVPNALDPTTTPYATFQVINNGVASNPVTVYTNLTAPGVFAFTENGAFAPGVGPANVTHADGSLVTADNPAQANETLTLIVTGLGAVNPPVADGAAAPAAPLSVVTANILVEIQDQNNNIYEAPVTLQSLLPGTAGMYQLQFTVPSGVPSGLAWVNVGTPDAYTSEAKLYMQ